MESADLICREIRPIGVCNFPIDEGKCSSADNILYAIRDRKAVENDGKKSPALQAMTKKFLAYHLASWGCNMATIGASFCYAICIAMRVLS